MPVHNRAAGRALEVYREVLAGVAGDLLVRESVRRTGNLLEIQDRQFDLDQFKNIFVCGAGKASFAMARELADILGGRLSDGLVVTKHGHGGSLGKIEVFESSHPMPDDTSLEAGSKMLEFASSTGPDDLVLFALSGGASALMEALIEGVILEDVQELNRSLLAEGKDIVAINRARSPLSRIKGGALGRAFGTSQIAVLVLSDVMGNRLDTIGSGPFWENDSEELIPVGDIWMRFKGHEPPVPAVAGKTQQSSVFHRFVGTPETALKLTLEKAGLAFEPSMIESQRLQGDARDEAIRIASSARNLPAGGCAVFYGESTVLIRGPGKGGRCQEIACAAATEIAGMENVAILAGSTDGTDGPTDVGAGLVDGKSIERAAANGVTAESALAQSDSNQFLVACDGLVVTGPTQSNLTDIVLVVR